MLDNGKLLRALRNAAYRKQQGRCYWCSGRMLQGKANENSPQYATAEHVYPVYAGGRTVHGNIVAACAKCNNERNTETNRTPTTRRTVLSVGDNTPRSPFERLKDVY